MSQHYFSTKHHGEAITVLLGWDRPLGHYFMVVERDDPKPKEFRGSAAGIRWADVRRGPQARATSI